MDGSDEGLFTALLLPTGQIGIAHEKLENVSSVEEEIEGETCRAIDVLSWNSHGCEARRMEDAEQ